MPFPLVIELQTLAVSHDTSVVQLVRAAKLVAAKLGLAQATDWIDRELNGYDNLSKLPSYRILHGECRAFNPYNGIWMQLKFPDADFEHMCSEGRIGQPLGSMESIINGDSDHAFLNFTYERQQILQQLFQEDAKFAIRVTKGQLEGVFDSVRNLTLDWTLKLEQAGVLGENMTFTLTEKQEAKPVTQQFFIQNAGVVGNVADNATVTNNQTVHGSLSVDRVRDLVQQAKSMLPALPRETAAQASTLLDELDSESRKSSPNEGKLRGALTSLRTVCEGAMGNLVASGITTAVTALLTHST
jgi:opacity protein-like surface antigen